MARKKSFDDLFDPLSRMRTDERRLCDHKGCDETGVYRAPKSPEDLTNYYYFCLDHVQAYNRAWNYYADMTEDEIEAQIRFDTIWQRPTWPLGGKRKFGLEQDPETLDDPFDIFVEERERAHARRAETEPLATLRSRERQAMALLDLKPPVTTDSLKSRFKELVKKLHPDANGGDKEAEERLRLVIEAYATLKTSTSFGEPSATH